MLTASGPGSSGHVPVSDTVTPLWQLRGESAHAVEVVPASGYRRPMARPPRLEDPLGIYHVTARGNNRQSIFFDAVDRTVFSMMLGRAVLKHRWIVLTYCLMTNHYHLVLEIPHGGLSAGMQELNGGYSRRTNRRYGRTGHLFRNRFGATTVETDSHLLEVCRYVVLNPVRVGLCAEPGEWRWSSYRASAGLEHAPRFLATDKLLGLFAPNPPSARAAFRSFVSEGPVPVSDTVTRGATQRDERRDGRRRGRSAVTRG